MTELGVRGCCGGGLGGPEDEGGSVLIPPAAPRRLRATPLGAAASRGGPMREYRSSARCVLAALTVTLAGPAAAQTRLEVGALLGLYAPASSFQPASYYSTALPNSPSDLTG